MKVKLLAMDFKELCKATGKTYQEIADYLGVSLTRVQNWARGTGKAPTQDIIIKLRDIVKEEITNPLRVVSGGYAELPFIGEVSAGSPSDWTDPLTSPEFQPVPITFAKAGRFCARVSGMSMYPMLIPGSTVIFQASQIPKLNIVSLHRSNDMQVTVKELKAVNGQIVLRAVNPAYDDEPATGTILGFLVGVIWEDRGRILTIFNESGLAAE